jgi:hypothetical protein
MRSGTLSSRRRRRWRAPRSTGSPGTSPPIKRSRAPAAAPTPGRLARRAPPAVGLSSPTILTCHPRSPSPGISRTSARRSGRSAAHRT